MKVELIYFKPSGKYYTCGEYDSKVEHMFQVFEEVRTMRDSGQPMPGLIGAWNTSVYASLNGVILINATGHPENYPGLIMPKPFLP